MIRGNKYEEYMMVVHMLSLLLSWGYFQKKKKLGVGLVNESTIYIIGIHHLPLNMNTNMYKKKGISFFGAPAMIYSFKICAPTSTHP